jgi:glutamate 5-kinase
VLKVGSSLLAADGGGLSPRHALGLAQFVSANVLAGREVVIVSSGAVAAGRAILPRADEPGAAMAARQALAALGQAQLIGLWQRFFERPVAQVLLTHDDLRNRRRYLNARATLNELLRLGALPVVNENDTVSVDELKLGDNDNLAATVAALVDADALFIATDIDGLYSADPRTVADARPLHDAGTERRGAGDGRRRRLARRHRRHAHQAGGGGQGGRLGIETYLFNGRSAVVRALAQDRLFGTRIHAARSREAARKHWLRHAPLAEGAIVSMPVRRRRCARRRLAAARRHHRCGGHSAVATWCRCAGTRRRAASASPAASASTRPTTCAASPAAIRATSRPCSATTTVAASSIATTWCCHDRFEGHPDERNRSAGACLP